MIKFNWGHGITLVFVVFIAFLATVLIKSKGIDHSLVTDDYYAKDIAYQKHFDKVANVSMYKKMVNVQWDNTDGLLSLNFNGNQQKKGNITFYRPSNQSSDFKKDFTMNEGQQKLEFGDLKLAMGKWKVQIEWNEGDIPFFIEKDIYVSTP